MDHKITVPLNDGSRRSSPHPITLPLRESLPEIAGEVVTWEFDRKPDGAPVCRIEVVRDGALVGVIEFGADHISGLKRLRHLFQNAWRANVLKSDAVLNFFGAMQRQ